MQDPRNAVTHFGLLLLLEVISHELLSILLAHGRLSARRSFASLNIFHRFLNSFADTKPSSAAYFLDFDDHFGLFVLADVVAEGLGLDHFLATEPDGRLVKRDDVKIRLKCKMVKVRRCCGTGWYGRNDLEV